MVGGRSSRRRSGAGDLSRICGGSFKVLKGHVAAHHQMTSDAYRINGGCRGHTRWWLPPTRQRGRSWPRTADSGRKVVAPQPPKTHGLPKRS